MWTLAPGAGPRSFDRAPSHLWFNMHDDPCGQRGCPLSMAWADGLAERHEVSLQQDGRIGGLGGRTARMIMRPPQQEQRGVAWEGRTASAAGSARDTASKLRQRFSLAARWPLARKP